ncbi:MAG: hypothetical protein JKY14_07190 [Paraglaciecola sp.]|nr:hypothetical protein [Paraglaciecola sp.]
MNVLFKIVFSYLLLSTSVNANTNMDFLVFPEIKLAYTDETSFSSDNITPSVDLFAAGNISFVNILAEAYVAEDLQHIERLQIGFNVSENSRLWFGRHHNSYGYWHTQYHHGTYLQTSIGRPSMVELGAAGGIVPSHSTGILLEGEIEQQTSAWHYALSVGLTAQLNPSSESHHGGSANASLQDFDILNSDPSEHELGYAFRLAYLPDALAETQVGAFITHGDIVLKADPEHMSDESHHEQSSMKNEIITLDIFGVFVNYQHQAWQLISEVYYVKSAVPVDMSVQKNSFSAAYLQVEYAIGEHWTPYMRIDRSFSYANDPYLQLLDGYPANANTLGLRLDLWVIMHLNWSILNATLIIKILTCG